MIRQEVSEVIQNGGEISTETEKKIHTIAKAMWDTGNISESYKFGDEEIFGYPLEFAYLLYCYPIQMIAVLQDSQKIQEYWEFYEEDYQN